jgi:hypothetical protein
MPAGQEPLESGMMKSMKLPGIKIIPKGKPIKWVIKRKIHGGFSICWVMSGSGAGTGLVIIQKRIRKIGVDLNQASTNHLAGLPQAVVGIARRINALATIETTAFKILAPHTWAFALPCLCNSFLLYNYCQS